MKKSALIGIIIFTLIVSVMPVEAKRGRQNRFDNPGLQHSHPLLTMSWNRVESIAQEIQMSDSQLDELKALRSEVRTEQEPMKSELKVLHQELRDLIQDRASDDKDEALKLVDKIALTQKNLMSSGINYHYKIQKLLTDAQKDQLRDLIQERREERREQRSKNQNRGGRRGGFNDGDKPGW